MSGYERAIAGAGTRIASSPITRTIPLFPRLSVVSRERDVLTVRNAGDCMLRTRVFGQPGYRLLAKLFDAGKEIADRWIELPRDLAPGDAATVTVPFAAGANLRLYHAIEGIPMLEPEAWHAEAL